MQKQHIKLDLQDRKELECLLSKSSLTVKIHKRIQVLLGLDNGKSYKTVGNEVGMIYISMREISSKYTDQLTAAQLTICLISREQVVP
jgi:hypothetical protein